MRKMTSLTATLAAAALFALTPAAFARHTSGDGRGQVRDDKGGIAHVQKGTDDPAGHDAGDDKGAKAKGADDPAGHDAGDDKGGRKGGRR
jgi:hypothetical protein